MRLYSPSSLSSFMEQALSLLSSALGTRQTREQRTERAIALAAAMMREAHRIQPDVEREQQAQLSRMMKDPLGKAFTTAMTDQCFRSHHATRVADQLQHLLSEYGVPVYLDTWKKIELKAFQAVGKSLAAVSVPLAKQALRKQTAAVILPGEPDELSRHMQARKQDGVRLNLNHLGEAILGEEEALRRLRVYMDDLANPEIEYVSIKISTIFSQIHPIAWEDNLMVLKDRLRQLYRASMQHTFQRADGTSVPKFVNLDMEEYKDLLLTQTLFQQVLDEQEFMYCTAGIVLQAYLPDSHALQQELTQWAIQRVERGAHPIKIRIVKGANLAMEQIEASQRGWRQAPYRQKIEVDANFKRMLEYALDADHARAVHVGVGSHNLFDIAYAMLLCTESRLTKEVTFEMLEGMADSLRRVVQSIMGSVLLYCPVATEDDFQSAIAYLIRRLDENTGPENFLRHAFGLKPGTTAWEQQADRFRASCKHIQQTLVGPRRQQDRFQGSQPAMTTFDNEPDTDFSLPANRAWAMQIMKKWTLCDIQPIPLVIAGKSVFQHPAPQGRGTNPSNSEEANYVYSMADWESIDLALETAKAAEASWGRTPIKERQQLLSSIAQTLRDTRGDLCGVMVRDAGKTLLEADPEVSEAIDFAEYYRERLASLQALEGISWKPKGTVLITPPWNFPISIPAGGILAALAAGNCVLFKPAPESVLCGWVLVNALWAAGVPKQVLQFINCEDDPVGSKLVADPRVNTIILTGATSTARLFKRLNPQVDLYAETGGKNAVIITALSDRDLAIKDLVQSAFGHAGQKCSAASLAIVEAEVYDDPHFRRQLKDAVESLRVGPATEMSTKVSPLIRPPGAALLRALTTLEPGEAWLVQPRAHATNPCLWSPGVKLGVQPGGFTHQTELFGPLLGVMRAQNLQEAISLANATQYGLTGGLQSLDEREQAYFLQHIEVGNAYINRGITGAIVERQPFGGCKASSFGTGAKAGGPHYLTQFVNPVQQALPCLSSVPIENALGSLQTWGIHHAKLPSDDISVWKSSIASYATEAQYYRQDFDPSLILGQDNLLRYLPLRGMTYRVQLTDTGIDLLRILAAAQAVECLLEVSYTPGEAPSVLDEEQLRPLLKSMIFVQETEAAFFRRVADGKIHRVRLASSPKDALWYAAAQSGTTVVSRPVLAQGKLELLLYLREMSISIDYHRYGNLGTRDGECRKPLR